MSDPVLTHAATSGTRDRVDLIYPPLASSSFGKNYPSTAVLAAFLAEAGIAAAQEDLNQRFAEYLLTQDVLDLLIAGGLCAPDAHEAAAGRWARTHRDLLVDPATGFLRFAAYLDYPQVLKSVAAPIAVDPGPAVLQALGEPGADAPHAPMVSIYRDFYHRNGIRDRVAGAALVGISVPMGRSSSRRWSWRRRSRRPILRSACPRRPGVQPDGAARPGQPAGESPRGRRGGPLRW